MIRKSITNINNSLKSFNPERRRFIKKAGLFAVSLGVSPYLLKCDDDIDDEKFYFAVLSDTHVMESDIEHTNKVLIATADILNNHVPAIDFVIITGDLCDSQLSEDPAFFESTTETHLNKLASCIDLFNMPVYSCMGNHDYLIGTGLTNFTLVDDIVQHEQLYIDFGIIPSAYHYVEYKGVKFYCLNSMQSDPSVDWVPRRVGTFGPDQLSWLDTQMSDGKPSFFFFHHPLATEMMANASFLLTSGIPFEVPRAESNLDKYQGTEFEDYTDPIYYNFLDTRPDQIKGVFVGHSHWFIQDTYNGIPILMTDAMKETKTFDSEEYPKRHHIVECSAKTGNFNVYNEYYILYGEDAL